MNFSLKARVLCGAALSALAIGGHAYAQDDAANESVESIAEETEEEARQEKIVVTGSLIARSNFTSASPIQIITAEEATLEGLIDTAALLQGSSIASGSTQLNNTFQNFVTNGGVGTRTLDLRGCGDVRTLILVNGKRPGPSGTRGAVSAFDLNNIPQSIVQRIEILKDGASTIYGSDAVCGVANIITRDTIDSPELTFSGTLPFESGGEEFRINGAFGLEFGDNVDLTFSAEYRLSNELNVGDRDYLNCERDRVTDPSTGAVLDRINASVTAGSGRGNCSNLYFNTVIDAFSFGSRLVPNPGGADAGSAVQGLFIPGYRPRANGVNSAGQLFYEDVLDAPFLDERDFFPENENIALFGTANVVLGQLDWDTQMLYNKRTTTVEGFRQFFPYVGSNDINNFGPGAGGAFGLNYLGDPGYVNSAGGLALPVMPYPTFDEISVEYVLLSSSLGGGFGDFLPDWSWNLSATYSRGDGDYSGSEILISKSGDWTLDGVADYTGDGVPDLVAPPTIDYFDPAILSGAAMDQLVAAVGGYQTGNTVYDQTTLTGVAAGELFDLPAGPVSVGLGHPNAIQ